MTYDELKEMSLASLLDASADEKRDPQERLQASEAVLARLPDWDGQKLDLEPAQRTRLDELCRMSGYQGVRRPHRDALVAAGA